MKQSATFDTEDKLDQFLEWPGYTVIDIYRADSGEIVLVYSLNTLEGCQQPE